MNLKVNGTGPEREEEPRDSRGIPMMLVNEVSWLMWETVRRQGAVHPVSQKSGQLILIELAKRDGRTQLELAEATHLKAPTVSVSLQKLEKEGYVSRRPDEYDLRATRVFLTEKGRDLDERIRGIIREQEERATSCLTDEESETLTRILRKLKDNLIGANEEEKRF